MTLLQTNQYGDSFSNHFRGSKGAKTAGHCEGELIKHSLNLLAKWNFHFWMISNSSSKNKSCTKRQNRELSIFPNEDDGNGKPAGDGGGNPECNARREVGKKYSLQLPMEASFECKQFSDFLCLPPINNKMFPTIHAIVLKLTGHCTWRDRR